MKTLYIWYVWLVIMIEKLFTKGDLPTVMEEVKPKLPMRLDIQFFADDDDDDDSDEDDDDNDDDSDDDDEKDDKDEAPDLDELLKDRAFRKQYNAKFKGQMAKRMKKKDEEIERLKGDKSKDKKKDDDKDDDDTSELETRLQDKEKRLLRAERREKRATVKEFAIDNGYDPKLLARLINLDEIELDEDGEPENIDELFDEIEEEFPGYFGAVDEDDDEDDEEEEKSSKRKKKVSYSPGSRQKGNRKKKTKPYDAGRLKALERHKKEEK